MDLSFKKCLLCIFLGDLLDEPCVDSSCWSRFRLQTSMKHSSKQLLQKSILKPTEVSTNMGSPC